eukprot:6265603-Prymnesium_polylepis.1
MHAAHLVANVIVLEVELLQLGQRTAAEGARDRFGACLLNGVARQIQLDKRHDRREGVGDGHYAQIAEGIAREREHLKPAGSAARDQVRQAARTLYAERLAVGAQLRHVPKRLLR